MTKSIPIALYLISTFFLLKPQLSLANSVNQLCHEASHKLRTIKLSTCINMKWQETGYFTNQNRPLVIKEVLPNKNRPPKGKILFIGGIHGDEYAAISLTYLWLKSLLNSQDQVQYQWLFLPIANPDGLMHAPATRTNANGVDLNRNFATPDWSELALYSWKNHYKKAKRRYPGPYAASEIETRWIQGIIRRYQPDAIISVHAPFGLLDYDGPEHATPNKIGNLKLRALGTYPGSLGRYAGEYLKIPVLTVELNNSGKLPNAQEIKKMWQDLESWIENKIKSKEVDF